MGNTEHLAAAAAKVEVSGAEARIDFSTIDSVEGLLTVRADWRLGFGFDAFDF